MKSAILIPFSAAILATGWLAAQTPAAPLIEPVTAPAEALPQQTPPPAVPALTPPVTPPALPPPPANLPLTPAVVPATAPFGPLEQQKKDMQQSEAGFIIKDASLNDIFQFLAKSAGRQYFHNTKIAGPEFLVTGHLNEGNPLQQMEELAFMYGLSLHTKGNTIYALTQVQLNQLPSIEFHYQLRYLRPTDIEQIKELIKPMLSPGTGIVNFEPKTSTIIIIDSAHRIEQARELLHGIDMTKGQIIVETKILRINSTAAERTGMNWSASLGKDGTSLSALRSLNSVFGFKAVFTDPSGIPTALGNTKGTTLGAVETALPTDNIVLSPIQLNGVLRALAEGGLSSQVSNPTLITEDNEQATISIIDRIPIVTQTQSGTGNTAIITEQVRYKIDAADKSIDTDPDKHREIGISLVVTPTVLPDGTIRMKLRPRSAQVVEQIKSVSGNTYPRVTESMVESLARVPDGYSLVVGGFYGEVMANGKTKIPLLGDIPVLNFFFKSKDATNEKTSLVFIVTPKSYDPSSHGSNNRASHFVRSGTTLDCDHDWIDPENPGPAHEPNLKRSLRGLQPAEAPYYPRTDEAPAAPTPAHATPAHSGYRAGH